jgi:hypothetical protein
MPSYLFCCTHETSSETVQRECQGPEQAIQYARRYLELTLNDASPATAPAYVSVAEEQWDVEPRWLGCWDFTVEAGWVWAPLE